MAQPKQIQLKTASLEAMRFQGTPDKLVDVATWVGGMLFDMDTPTPTLEFPIERAPQAKGGHIWVEVKLGEWIVKTATGTFSVWNDNDLKEMYDVS